MEPAAALSAGRGIDVHITPRCAAADVHGAAPAGSAPERAVDAPAGSAAYEGASPGPRARVTSPDDAAREQGRQALLVLFAGEQRPHDLEHAFTMRGWDVTAVDIKREGAEHNLLRPVVADKLLEAVSLRRFEVVWLGTPCASFSVWKTDARYPVIRSRAHPQGVPDGPADWAAYVAKHNELVRLSVTFARAASLRDTSRV
ncbi:hypothetical protein AB1Y20_014149 [Prymnesium parvum]|uniref:Uncharacterized protein n=1 Tax=Prymnesium parvum TaxID=97485 RepID=A0AB34IEX7_PRYPA